LDNCDPELDLWWTSCEALHSSMYRRNDWKSWVSYRRTPLSVIGTRSPSLWQWRDRVSVWLAKRDCD
jgi:hypothetical protein